jgi:signal transduction histidine kinase/ActR/RegA family two-component response regulator
VLIACPMLARLAGVPIALADSLMLSVCGGIYVVFIVRLAGNIDAEGQALRKALDDAEVAARAKSDFLTVIGHEIRTPLNGVLGMAQAMAFEPLASAQRERLDVIRDSGVALLSLIDDVLDFSRMEAGEIRIAAVEFDLRAVLIGIHAASASEAERKCLDFQLAIDPAVARRYRGDGPRVRQMICHLVANALKFTRAGSVRLQLDAQPGGVAVSVHDTGIGMDAEVVSRLFESFQPGDSAINRSHGGSGLGLALCHHLCTAMNGDITVASTRGRGSVFTVRLPLSPAQASPETAALQRSGPLRILAAEDNPVNQQVLATLLAHLGLSPVIVADGAQALEAWRQADWDLILMDIQMPVMDGLSASREIRRRETETGRPRTPILALTANAMRDQVDAYHAAGIDAVVAKPISVCDLFGAIVAATDAACQAGAPSASPILRASSARR